MGTDASVPISLLARSGAAASVYARALALFFQFTCAFERTHKARNAPTNLPDDQPWATPRAWAAKRGHKEIAKRLHDAGAA